MDKVAFIRSAIRQMAEYTFPYVGSIAGVVDQDTGEFIGSGARLVLRGRRVIATALHVMEAANGYRGSAFSTGPDQPLHVLSGHVHFERTRDIAVHPLDPTYDRPHVRFWPDSRIDRADDHLSSDFLFVHGFPGARSRFLRLLDNSLFASSMPYGAMRRVDGISTALESDQFAISFDPGTMKRADTGEPFFVDPHGMSGSPVWRMGMSGRAAQDWTPELSMLVGIVTHWSQRDATLIATRAHRLLDIPLE